MRRSPAATEAPALDPYVGNILVEPFGSIRDLEQTLGLITVLPRWPENVASMPRHVRLHYAMDLRDMYIPPPQAGTFATTFDLMLRQGYKYRDPANASTWARIAGYNVLHRPKKAPPSAALIGGESGTGKTRTFDQIAGTYPQVIEHQAYPGINGSHLQVVYLSVNVPAGGRPADLARTLGIEWDRVTGGTRFAKFMELKNPHGNQMLDEWLLVAATHSLGILHLDEVQNFFKIPTVEERRKKRAPGEPSPMLRIVDDTSLKWLLTLMNFWGIPVVMSGTHDGVGALTKRLSTVSRFSTMGYYSMECFTNPNAPFFREILLANLLQLQLVKDRIADSDDLARTIIGGTAGVPRHVIAHWIAAHRVAYDRAASNPAVDNLLLEDFRIAASTYLRLLQPCVKALLSNDPRERARYEDLVPRDDDFWASFWTDVSSR